MPAQSDELVCPECGHNRFTRDAPATIRITVAFDKRTGCELEIAEEVMDTDRDGDYTCEDCGEEYGTAQELVTEEAYNADEECPRCGAEDNDKGFCTDPECPCD